MLLTVTGAQPEKYLQNRYLYLARDSEGINSMIFGFHATKKPQNAAFDII